MSKMKRNHKKRFYCGGYTKEYEIARDTDSIFVMQKDLSSLYCMFEDTIIDIFYKNHSKETLDICYVILKHKPKKDERHNLQLLQKKLFAYFAGMPQNTKKYMLPEMLFSWKRFKELGLMSEMFYPMKVLKSGLRIF